MIEIVYDRNAAKNDLQNGAGYRLPKNIRQIGNTPNDKKIYVEDYVMTYLRKIAEPGNTCSRGAILLGERFVDDSGEVLFISGAVEAQNLEFDVDEIRFTDEIWSSIYAEINKYFDNLSVVGWFLSRMGFSVALNDKIVKIHMDNFGTDDKVLFMMDSLECEDAFYSYDKGMLVRQKGYYVYYVRNEKMQNYIISRNSKTTEDESESSLKRDKAVVKNFKAMRTENSDENTVEGNKYAMYAVSSFAMVFALSAGILALQKNGKLDSIFSKKPYSNVVIEREKEVLAPTTLEYSYEQIESEQDKKSLLDKDETGVEFDPYDENDSEKHEDSNYENVEIDNANQELDLDVDSVVDSSDENDENNNDVSEKQTKPEDNTDDIQKEKSYIYIIEEGDTLMSISLKMYKSPNYVDAIMDANDFEDDTIIHTGDKIVIPYID